MKAIIYYRKSTDRDDKQANSLEHQLGNCRNTAERLWLEICEEFWESRSAKTEFTREKFNEMIALCKKGKIDYIIADEPKRLSRNNIDTSRIIDLLDKKQIKWVICTSREYHAENSRDKFLLQLDLSLSKMDNEDRAKDIKDKMITCLKKGQVVIKAPDGYKNVTYKKGHKWVEINESRAKFIREMFDLRCQWYSIAKLVDILHEKGFRSSNGKKIHHEQMKKKLQNKFYMWIMVWGGEEYVWNYIPLISKSMFYTANTIQAKRIYTYRKKPFTFSGILKTEDGHIMRGDKTKDRVYYRNGAKIQLRVNISEKLVIAQVHEIFKERELPDKAKKIGLDILEQMYKNALKLEQRDTQRIENDIDILKERKSRLVDSFLDGDIEREVYKQKLQSIDIELSELEEKLNVSPKFDRAKLKKLQEVAELLFSAYSRQSELTIEQRVKILKSLVAELYITSKKELRIADSRLVETLSKLNIHIWYSHGESNSGSRNENPVS